MKDKEKKYYTIGGQCQIEQKDISEYERNCGGGAYNKYSPLIQILYGIDNTLGILCSIIENKESNNKKDCMRCWMQFEKLEELRKNHLKKSLEIAQEYPCKTCDTKEQCESYTQSLGTLNYKYQCSCGYFDDWEMRKNSCNAKINFINELLTKE